MDKQQLGGAQALLELGTKKTEDQVKNSTDQKDYNEEDDDTKATNQQINDAVEAAVLKYVGGNLEADDTPKKRRKLNEDLISIGDFQNWNFLEDEEEPRKKLSLTEIDPELSELSDPLVRAALLETRELARQMGGSFHGSAHNVVNNDPPPEAKENPFSGIKSIEMLTEEAQKISMLWFKNSPETKGARPFSSEEMRALAFFIDGYGYLFKMDRKAMCNRIWTSERKKDSFWEYLTKVVPYRSRASTYKHVRRQYHPFEVRGKWTKQDDDHLKQLAITKLNNWKEIGGLMGRMPEDCRDRWRNYIKCGDQRMENKWSVEEENELKQIISDMQRKLNGGTINWTLVSEAMKGTRSRIQCRYKWNKLVKRDSINRSSFMDIRTKLWLFEMLQKCGYKDISAVDWNYIAQQYKQEFHNSNWGPNDFEFGFGTFITAVKDYKSQSFEALIENYIKLCSARDKEMAHQQQDYLWSR